MRNDRQARIVSEAKATGKRRRGKQGKKNLEIKRRYLAK